MSVLTDCRLCGITCNDFRRLYDEQQQCIAELYDIAAQYFHPMFLSLSKETDVTALCLECWHLIVDFNGFQQKIFKTQAKLMRERKRKCLSNLAEKSVEMASLHVDDIVKTEYEFSNAEIVATKIASEATAQINEKTLEDITNLVKMASPQVGDIIITAATVNIEEEFLENITNTVAENVNKQINNEAVANTVASQSNALTKQESLSDLKIKEEIVDLDSSFDSDMQEEFLPEEVNKSVEGNEAEENSDYEEAVGNLTGGEFDSTVQNEVIDVTEANTMGLENQDTNSNLTKILSFAHNRSHSDDERNEIIAVWRSLLNCPLCLSAYPNVDELRIHFHQNHSGQRIYIKCCGVKLRGRCSIAEHGLYHLIPTIYKCEFCNKCYKRQNALRHHKLTATYCAQKSRAKDNLENIESSSKDNENVTETGHVQTSYKCEFCQKCFIKLQSLKYHMYTTHSSQKLEAKDISKNNTGSSRKLNKNAAGPENASLTHTNSLYKCKVCNKKFKSKKTLKCHKETHLT